MRELVEIGKRYIQNSSKRICTVKTIAFSNSGNDKTIAIYNFGHGTDWYMPISEFVDQFTLVSASDTKF